jgi:hypothetical protein
MKNPIIQIAQIGINPDFINTADDNNRQIIPAAGTNTRNTLSIAINKITHPIRSQ